MFVIHDEACEITSSKCHVDPLRGLSLLVLRTGYGSGSVPYYCYLITFQSHDLQRYFLSRNNCGNSIAEYFFGYINYSTLHIISNFRNLFHSPGSSKRATGPG